MSEARLAPSKFPPGAAPSKAARFKRWWFENRESIYANLAIVVSLILLVCCLTAAARFGTPTSEASWLCRIVEHWYDVWWGYLAALIPAILVALQGLYMVAYRVPALTAEIKGPSDGRDGDRRQSIHLVGARDQIEEQSRYFLDTAAIGRQYTVYTLLLAAVAIMLFEVCYVEPALLQKVLSPHIEKDVALKMLAALRLGAVGASIYALSTLGVRTFQRDVTGPIAIWSTTQLVLGPILAAACAFFLVSETKTPPGEIVEFSAVYFFAGLAPRTLIDWVMATVQKIYLQTGSAQARRTVPLANVRGISASVESRLIEEGIDDAILLAMANPVKLLRNTPFAARQLLSWIDEALLILALPKHYLALQELGVTGAIDLAWYALDDNDDEDEEDEANAESGKRAPLLFSPPPTSPSPLAPSPVPLPPAPGPSPATAQANSPAVVCPAARPDIPQEITDLAAAINIKEGLLWDTARRLKNDDQLEMIWAMYESNGAAPAADA